jgi:hypothetical protein
MRTSRFEGARLQEAAEKAGFSWCFEEERL